MAERPSDESAVQACARGTGVGPRTQSHCPMRGGFMKKKLLAVLIGASLVGVAAPAFAITDEEGNASIQFAFVPPGARSLGMGGAFVGRADDATAAYTNPAGPDAAAGVRDRRGGPPRRLRERLRVERHVPDRTRSTPRGLELRLGLGRRQQRRVPVGGLAARPLVDRVLPPRAGEVQHELRAGGRRQRDRHRPASSCRTARRSTSTS